MKHHTYGIHSVVATIKSHPNNIELLMVQHGRRDKRIQAVLDLAQAAKITQQEKTKDELDQIVDGNHQGVVAVCTQEITYSEYDLEDVIENSAQPFILILDGIQDPHNLGACLRSADAAAIDAVIVPKDKAVGITDTVRKVASGAAETVPFIQVTNLARTMRMLQEKGIWLYGAAGEVEQSIYETDLSGPMALVLGAEGKGLRRLTREHCDHLFNIPMQGTVSSLNVSVATGICLFEAVRQRQTKL